MFKKLFLAMLLGMAMALPVKADWAAVSPEGFVVATEQPCPETIAARIKPELRDKFHLAVGKFGDNTYAGCWVVHEQQVFVVWEDGDTGVIPQSLFKKLKPA